MKNTMSKSCVLNQDKMLSEYTWISSFCFVKIGHIENVGGLQSIQEWCQATLQLTVSPYYIHDEIYHDCYTQKINCLDSAN